MMKLITSAQNGLLKHLAKILSSAKYRREQRQTALEGVHLLQAFLDSGGVPLQVLLPETRLNHPEICALIGRLPADGLYAAADKALAKISSLAEGADIIALIEMPCDKSLPPTGDCVVLEQVQDPGNIGTILRSAAAAGVKQIVADKGCADIWSPKVLRAGMGAHFLLDIAVRADLSEWRQLYREAVYATALDSRAVPLYALDLRRPAAWLFGNEGSGASPAALALADKSVLIPMAGATESLNVAMAATVCLFEQMRQRL